MCSKKNWNILRRLKKLTPHTSHLTPRTSHLVPHTSHLTPHTSYLTPHTSHLTPLFAFCFLLLSTFLSCDKTEIVRSVWNLQGVSINDKEVTDSDEYHLKLFVTNYYIHYANSLDVRTVVDGQQWGTPNGFYIYNYKNKTLQMRFTLVDQHSEIMAKIKKLTRNEMRLEYEKDGNIYLLKLFSR